MYRCLFMCLHISVCTGVQCLWTPEVLGSLELRLQMVMICPTSMLETELWSYERASDVLNIWVISPALRKLQRNNRFSITLYFISQQKTKLNFHQSKVSISYSNKWLLLYFWLVLWNWLFKKNSHNFSHLRTKHTEIHSWRLSTYIPLLVDKRHGQSINEDMSLLFRLCTSFLRQNWKKTEWRKRRRLLRPWLLLDMRPS